MEWEVLTQSPWYALFKSPVLECITQGYKWQTHVKSYKEVLPISSNHVKNVGVISLCALEWMNQEKQNEIIPYLEKVSVINKIKKLQSRRESHRLIILKYLSLIATKVSAWLEVQDAELLLEMSK